MEVPSIRHILSNCLILSVISTIVIAQSSQKSQNPCKANANCHECIQTPSCAWCFDPDFKGGARCFQPSNGVISNQFCHEEFVLNPENILTTITNVSLTKGRASSSISQGGGGSFEFSQGGSFSGSSSSSSWSKTQSMSGSASKSSSGSGYSRIVQMAPQRLNLKLRARTTYSIQMYYMKADYPVDLYYLMDLSKSMEDDKHKLYTLGDQLAFTMRNLTSDFRLGFGSFVDKVVMPYVSTLAEKLRHPCDKCVAPYGYRHHMTLSNNTHMFSHMVKQADVSGNLDAPEGGFDAIMQAIVCQDQIGWREKARKLLVFSTDASFHFAGDGKLGGIVKPNDGCCHLSREGVYTESSHQDYPSIEQINLTVKKHFINMIFAVTENTLEIYKELALTIEGASVGKLEGDSSNIVDLISKQYQKISSKVEMKHNATKDVSLKFYTRCMNTSGPLIQTNICEDIKIGNVVQFRIDIEVKQCPKNRADHFQTINIYSVGIDESLIIDLEMLCECDCERPGSQFYEELSPKCNHHGTYKCGVCDCVGGAFGQKCECSSDGLRNATTTDCIDPNKPGSLECSGRGNCVCGRCECNIRENDKEFISGRYCECDNFSCERHDSKLCSDHGTCVCNVCQCNDEWTGTNCACKKSTVNCYAPFGDSKAICSGHGHCECGRCVCDQVPEGRYTGMFCERCPGCSDMCDELKDCVQCQKGYPSIYKDNVTCIENCQHFTPVDVEVVQANSEEGETLCAYRDENNCDFAFMYYYDENKELKVKAQKERKCPDKVQLPAIILGVIAAVVLMGMALLLLWKVYTTIQDRREMARFEKERMMAKWETGCPDRCLEFKECVQCRGYKTGRFKDPADCESNCTNIKPVFVEEVAVRDDSNEILCAYYDEDECRFTYIYSFDTENKIQVRALKERECLSKVFVPGIVFGVIAAVVLIGMAILLLWKLLTSIQDRQEFARFEKEKMMAKWDTGENPIYKQATSTFKNPTYAGKC